MKLFCFAIVFIVSNIVSSQELYEVKNITDFEEVLRKFNGQNIYDLDINELKNLIKVSSKEFHLIYTYGYWCKPCIETLPSVLKFESNAKLELYLINIENKDKDFLRTKNFLKEKFDYLDNTFTITDDYGKSSWKKYKNFVEELVPGHNEYGMSLFILLNKNAEVLFASSYKQEKDLKIEKIKKIILDTSK